MKIAIIPARGGSKRIPKKNLINFVGRPMITHAIDHAKNTKLFDEIIVSTDCPDIARVAKEAGANAPFLRPEKIADDYATMTDVLIHFTNWLDEKEMNVQDICCLFPATPLLKTKDIIRGYDTLIDSEADGAFSVIPFPSKVQRALEIDGKGFLKFVNLEYEFTRTQDLSEFYYDAGQFYWLKKSRFQEEKRLVLKKSFPVIMDPLDVVDIDTMEDLKKAEILYNAFYRLSGEINE